jgi:hypothetical protein
MTKLLKLAQLPEGNHMPKVDIRETGVKALFKPQFFTGAEQLNQLSLNDNFRHPTPEQQLDIFVS